MRGCGSLEGSVAGSAGKDEKDLQWQLEGGGQKDNQQCEGGHRREKEERRAKEEETQHVINAQMD